MRFADKHNETSICRICLEPVQNFICAGCLFKNVRRWVSEKAPAKSDYINLLLKGKHEGIKQMLESSQNRAFCISCGDNVDGIACPCCYLYEMQLVIKSVDSAAAREFEKDFNFDFTFHHGMSQLSLWESIHGRLLSSRAFRPITITDRKASTDMSMCESCEVESDVLVEVEGRWLCESCRDESLVVY